MGPTVGDFLEFGCHEFSENGSFFCGGDSCFFFGGGVIFLMFFFVYLLFFFVSGLIFSGIPRCGFFP